MKHFDAREKLIDQTISVIATLGFDGATTRGIVGTTSINEAYIYRCFRGKEDLMAEAFATIDEEIYHLLDDLADSNMDDLQATISSLWNYLLDNRDKTLAYTQYWYSPYYQWNSIKRHIETYEPLIEKYSSCFAADANVEMLLQYMICALANSAVNVFRGSAPNDEKTEADVIRAVYHSISPFFAENKK